jgi:hypothetical protein
VDIAVQGRAEVLHEADGPGEHASVAVLARGAPLPGEDRAQEEAEHLAEELLVPGEEEADLPRERDDPLPIRDSREDVVGQAEGCVVHPPSVASWAYP